MKKLLLGATAFATLALFSSVASAQVPIPGTLPIQSADGDICHSPARDCRHTT